MVPCIGRWIAQARCGLDYPRRPLSLSLPREGGGDLAAPQGLPPPSRGRVGERGQCHPVHEPNPQLALRCRAGHDGDQMVTRKTPHIGSSFEDFLTKEGLADDANVHAIKRVVAWQIAQAMQEQQITKAEMAKRMRTSRAHLDRLLDPDNDRVQLDTVQRAATAVGRKLRVELV